MKNLTKLLSVFSLIIAVFIVNSCQKQNSIEENKYQNLPTVIANAANWFDRQIKVTDFVGKKTPDWNNARISKTYTGESQVLAPLYVGKNVRGLDSIQEICIILSKDESFRGSVRIKSAYNAEGAGVEFFTFNGRLLETGDMYLPTEAYSLLKLHAKSTIKLMGGEEGAYYSGQTQVPGSFATPRFNPDGSHNSNAFNCHQYVWGDPSPYSYMYDPRFPHWNNSPTITGTQLSASQAALVGDKVVYYDPYGVPLHSAFVTQVDASGSVTQVTGKLGQDAIYSHHPAAAPSEYMTGYRKYYR